MIKKQIALRLPINVAKALKEEADEMNMKFHTWIVFVLTNHVKSNGGK